jgi:hypothetical protein
VEALRHIGHVSPVRVAKAVNVVRPAGTAGTTATRWTHVQKRLKRLLVRTGESQTATCKTPENSQKNNHVLTSPKEWVECTGRAALDPCAQVGTSGSRTTGSRQASSRSSINLPARQSSGMPGRTKDIFKRAVHVGACHNLRRTSWYTILHSFVCIHGIVYFCSMIVMHTGR